MSYVAAVAPVLPVHSYEQTEITDALGGYLLPSGTDRRLLDRIHAAAQVRRRHLALPLDAYGELNGFGKANDVFIDVALDLGERAMKQALDGAGLAAADVDLLVATSITGIAAPSIDARLVPRLGLRTDVKRLPIFGLGCVAGAAGVSRLHDYLLGHPDGVAVLLSVELCSLTVQRDDPSMANLVASGLFGDGAAAVVMVGARRAASMGLAGRPEVVATRSRLYPDTERLLGWDVVDSGFRIVLDTGLAAVVEANIGADIDGFLAENHLGPTDIAHWMAHPGGPAVLDAVQRAASLPDDALAPSRELLAHTGNLSSAAVLHLLAATLDGAAPEPGETGLLLAMGPGFCAELVLLRW